MIYPGEWIILLFLIISHWQSGHSEKENRCRRGRPCTYRSQRQWKSRENGSNVTPWLLYSPAIISPPILCHCLRVYSRQESSEVAARLMMLLFSLTFLTAELTARWRVSRAAPTHRPLQCFSIVPGSLTHTLPLIRTNMSVYQLQSTHLPCLPASRVKNAANEKNVCALVLIESHGRAHTYTLPNTHLCRSARSERWEQRDDLMLPPGQRSWVHIIQSYLLTD